MWQGYETGRDVNQLRDHNRGLVLRWLTRRPNLSRSDIAKRVKLTDPAISRIVRDLMAAGLVREGTSKVVYGRSGRRHIGLELVPNVAFAAAIRLTVSDPGVSLVDLTGNRRADVPLPDLLTAQPESIPLIIAAGVERAISQARTSLGRLLGIGVVTVGAVNELTGQIRKSSISGLSGQFLGPDIERRLGRPVRVRTLGQALNLAEALLAFHQSTGSYSGGHLSTIATSSDRGTALLAHVALGLGASLIVNGRLQGGDSDERLIGHVQLPGGRKTCVCGQVGCLLTEASGHAVMRRLDGLNVRSAAGGRLHDYRAGELLQAVQKANSGDPEATAAFRKAGHVLGFQLFGISSVLSPDRVILAGVVGQARPYAKGVEAGISEAWGRAGEPAPPLLVSNMDYRKAAELFALDEFLLNSPVDLQSSAAA